MSGSDTLASLCRNVLRREAVLLKQSGAVHGLAKVIEGDDPSGLANPAVPRKRNAGLDSHACANRRGEDRLAVGLVLVLKPLNARNRDNARGNSLGLQQAMSLQSRSYL